MGWLQDLIREMAGGGEIDSKDVAREAARRGFAVNDSSVSQAMRRAADSGELRSLGRFGGGRDKGPGSRRYVSNEEDE